MTQVAWRPNGRQFVAPGTFIADADGTNVRELPIGSVGLFPGLKWSPDGRHLAFMTLDVNGDHRRISIADIGEDGEARNLRPLILDPESSDAWAPSRSPDGSLIAVVNPDGTGYRIVWPVLPERGDFGDYTWSPDGRSLVISEATEIDDDGRVVHPAEKAWTVDVATGEQTEVQHPVGSWQRLAPDVRMA